MDIRCVASHCVPVSPDTTASSPQGQQQRAQSRRARLPSVSAVKLVTVPGAGSPMLVGVVTPAQDQKAIQRSAVSIILNERLAVASGDEKAMARVVSAVLSQPSGPSRFRSQLDTVQLRDTCEDGKGMCAVSLSAFLSRHLTGDYANAFARWMAHSSPKP